RPVDVDVERREEDRHSHGGPHERIDGVLDRNDLAVGRRQHAVGHERDGPLGVAEEAGGGRRRRRERQRQPAMAEQREPERDGARDRDERPAFPGDRQLGRHHSLGGLIQDIIARSRLPTSSIWCSASRRRMARKPARLAWFSSTHLRANWPDWISPKIFFISALVWSDTMRGPRV